MGDDSEWMKLPAEDKCSHKVWKARMAGYGEVIKIFETQDNEKSPEFMKYAGLMKKVVIDNNAVAQEKGLELVVSFLENASTQLAARTINEVVSGIVTKCLSATKQKTKEKGMEIIMLYMELDKPDLVQEALMTGLENKNPKVVIGSVQCLKLALRDFGTKVVQVKPLLKCLPKLLDDRDKNVREETKQLVIELYRWIGAALKPQMTNFKPIQVQEFEEEFEKMPSGKPTQSRFMRSQQDLKAKMEAQATASTGGGDDDNVEEEAEEDVDPYELLSAVDVLSKIPKDFYEKIEAKKWQDRREALEAVQRLLESPKIENGTYGTLVSALLKVVAKDSNVMLVTLAGNCIASLAKGLRKNYLTYATQTMSVILEKFKEKKAAVVAALREASDATYSCGVTLEALMEDIVAALDNKNPSIKAETVLFLSRCFARCTQATLPKKQLKVFCASLLKTINDTDPVVREASFEALGVAMKVVSEKHVMPFLADVDPLKLQKIQEKCQSAVLLNAKGEPRAGTGGGGAGGEMAKKNEPKPVARPTTVKPAAKSTKKPAAKKPGSAGAKGVKGKGKAPPKGGKADVPAETILSDEAVEEKAAAALPADVLSGLESANWKERLAATEKLSTVVKTLSKEEIPCQVFVRVLKKKPGLKETNFQVLKLKLELLSHLAQNAKFSRQSAEFVLTEIIDKVGDVKNGSIAQECLSCISEACLLEYVSDQAMSLAFEQKNPKNQSETLIWLAGAIKEFGFKVPIKPLIATINKGLAATQPTVRTAAINVLGTAYMYMGAKLRMFFEEEKPALLQQIDAEIEKVKDQKPPPATRGLSPGGDGGDDAEEEGGQEKEPEEAEVQDLVPRVDISERITEALLTQMTDKNWKVRNEGLQKVTEILKEAKFVTANLAGLPEAIKARLGESNKNLQMTAITICSTLAVSLGPHAKHHVKTIAPGLISCLSDSKPQLRSAVVASMNLWVEQTTLLPLVECEAIQDGLKIENPNLRAELLGWLAEKLPTHKILPPELRDCALPVLNCLEDRSVDVRKKAQEAIVPFMIHIGYNNFMKAVGKLKPASKDQVMPLLEKARGDLPAKAPPPKKKAEGPPPKAASRPASAYDDEEEESKSAAAPSKPEAKADLKTKALGKAKAKAPASSSKKNQEEETGPVMTLTVPLAQRIKDEKNMKILKWNFIELRGEFVEQLKLQMEKNFSPAIMAQLFHSDFKFHIKAIEQLIGCLDGMEKETEGNLDMILKWCTIRFFDTNPSMINKALDYLQRLFALLADCDYNLSDLDATSFIPYLVLKVGESKDNVRRDVRNLFKLICKVYPASKLFVFLLDGLKSKNSKQRTECLEEMGCLIEQYGVNICQPTPAQALKAIAGQIGDRDNGVRNAALNTAVTAYQLVGENIYKLIGHLKEKDQSLLDERIKRSMKNKPAAKPVVEERPRTAPAPQASKPQPINHRPSTAAAMGKPSSSSSLRKEYALDVDTEPSDQMPQLQLIQHDLDHIYEPVKLPIINARQQVRKHLTASDAAATIGYVISQVTSTDIGVGIQALAQIDEVLRDDERAEALTGHVDKLLLMLSMQFRMTHSTHMSDPKVSRNEIVRLYRCLLSTLLQIFQNNTLARKASKDVLRDLMTSLVALLLDDRLMEVDDGPQVVRSVNITVIRIVEHADCTSIMGALIRLLQDCVASETTSAKFVEIVMKCLWKMVRMLPNNANELNIDKILLDAHQFMRAFPGNTWKERASDQPLRTIKTVLHSLAKQKGNKILSHTGLIDSNSEVEAYLHKVLKDGVAGNNARNDEMSENARQGSSSKSKRLSKSTHDMLVEIFKKIGSKENTKEGLNDLYDFKKKQPDADLEPFLKKSSQFFQNYIERGVKNIELEREGKKPESYDPIPTMKPLSENTTNGESPDYYKQRLTAIRAQCGLDSSESRTDKTAASSKSSQSSSEVDLENIGSSTDSLLDFKIPAVPKQEAPPKPAVDVSDLKMRLDRIKRMATPTGH